MTITPLRSRCTAVVLLAVSLLVACGYPFDQSRMDHAQKMYLNQNYHTAFVDLIPLANHGRPDAQYAIGYLLYFGKGCVEDQAKGIRWMRLAAKQGYPEAIAALKVLSTEPTKKIQPYTNIEPEF